MSLLQDYSNMLVSNFAFSSVFTSFFFFLSNESLLIKKKNKKENTASEVYFSSSTSISQITVLLKRI